MEGMPAPHVSLEQQILQYYESGQEADRLESPFSRWEKLRTLDLLDRFLPRAPALILDVGGAAGAYAFPLATKDYVVDLIDPVPLHVEQAKQARCRSGTPFRSADITFGKLALPPPRNWRSPSPMPSPTLRRPSRPAWRWIRSPRGFPSSSTRTTIFWRRSPSSARRAASTPT